MSEEEMSREEYFTHILVNLVSIVKNFFEQIDQMEKLDYLKAAALFFNF
jgi:hypothetical protein